MRGVLSQGNGEAVRGDEMRAHLIDRLPVKEGVL